MYQKNTDWLHVQIVKSPLFTNNSEKLLEDNLRTELGDALKITFEYRERIPREKSGKLRYFVSEINDNR
jgi:phenylacetate-coenzyme A ligase PaaK-like adenylate-forming protein